MTKISPLSVVILRSYRYSGNGRKKLSVFACNVDPHFISFLVKEPTIILTKSKSIGIAIFTIFSGKRFNLNLLLCESSRLGFGPKFN